MECSSSRVKFQMVRILSYGLIDIKRQIIILANIKYSTVLKEQQLLYFSLLHNIGKMLGHSITLTIWSSLNDYDEFVLQHGTTLKQKKIIVFISISYMPDPYY